MGVFDAPRTVVPMVMGVSTLLVVLVEVRVPVVGRVVGPLSGLHGHVSSRSSRRDASIEAAMARATFRSVRHAR